MTNITIAASVVFPDFLIAPNTSSGYSKRESESLLQESPLGLGQHERLAGLGITEDVLEEREGVTLEAGDRGSVNRHGCSPPQA
jgi:hypothetical protein